jgi:hypothetical protein
MSAASKWIVEAKVVASSAASFAASMAVAVLNQVEDDHELLGSTPAPVQFVILAVIPTAITFLGGWSAKHTPRPADGP